jgi:hypothetical protein
MFEDTFYIMETSPGWYQARMVKTHFCFSAGTDLQKRLDGISKLVTQHRTVEHILKSHEGEDGNNSNHMSVATTAQHLEQFSDRGHLYDDDILMAIQKGVKARVNKDPLAQSRKRLGALVRKSSPEKEVIKRPVIPNLHKSREDEKTVPVHKKPIPLKTIKRTV